MSGSGSSGTSAWGLEGGFSEIEEEEEEDEQSSSELFHLNGISISTNGGGVHSRRHHQDLDTIREEVDGNSLFSFDLHNGGEDAIYVAVGNKASDESSSMDALLWTLNHALVNPSSTIIFLVHVFPEIKHIPMPLGMMAVSQVNPEQKENYMAQERGKRREFLHKFLNACSTAKIKVDTILIESDLEAKAILDLIPILNITKLVLGTTKANLSKMRSRRASGIIVDQILKGAPEFCNVKIICEGKETPLDSFFTNDFSPSPRGAPPPYRHSPPASPVQNQDQVTTTDSFRCGSCFKPKVMS